MDRPASRTKLCKMVAEAKKAEGKKDLAEFSAKSPKSKFNAGKPVVNAQKALGIKIRRLEL